MMHLMVIILQCIQYWIMLFTWNYCNVIYHLHLSEKNELEKGILTVQYFENMTVHQVNILTLKNISGNGHSHLIGTCLRRLYPSISKKSKVSSSDFARFEETKNNPPNCKICSNTGRKNISILVAVCKRYVKHLEGNTIFFSKKVIGLIEFAKIYICTVCWIYKYMNKT